MTTFPFLRSPYDKVGGLFHFGRMLDKARAADRGDLPEAYHGMLGNGFDGRLCRYLSIEYEKVRQWATELDDDEAIARRCFDDGRQLADEDRLIWNSFVSKRGWRDDETDAHIPSETQTYGLDDDGSIVTDFDLLQADEGRPLDGWRAAWGLHSRHSSLPESVEALAAAYRRHAQPQEPLKTDIESKLTRLEGIRTVVFDIYGTLMISGSGELSLVPQENGDALLREVLAQVGLANLPSDVDLDALFKRAAEHAREVRRQEGIAHPEVDIREIWTAFFKGLALQGVAPVHPSPHVLDRLAIEHQARFAAVWPMPHLSETLAHLRGLGIFFGILSNAQFYTRALFPAFLGQPLAQLGFALDCCIFSYREREEKPSAALFRKMIRNLAGRGIAPGEVLFVGNDMNNDLQPAMECGMRTALFAGDARSLRWNKDNPGVRPDVIISDLYQLTEILGPQRLSP